MNQDFQPKSEKYRASEFISISLLFSIFLFLIEMIIEIARMKYMKIHGIFFCPCGRMLIPFTKKSKKNSRKRIEWLRLFLQIWYERSERLMKLAYGLQGKTLAKYTILRFVDGFCYKMLMRARFSNAKDYTEYANRQHLYTDKSR